MEKGGGKEVNFRCAMNCQRRRQMRRDDRVLPLGGRVRDLVQRSRGNSSNETGWRQWGERRGKGGEGAEAHSGFDVKIFIDCGR